MLRNYSRCVSVVVLVLAIWASAFGPLDRWINQAALGQVSQSNAVYLEESFDEASRLFLILTGVKTVLAIIEGSDVGVGFSLQVGDVVKAVYDYIDFAWTVMLLATLALLMTQMLLETALWADSPLLTLTLIALLAYLLVKWWVRGDWGKGLRHILRDLSYFLVTITLAAYLLLPLSVAAGAKLSGEITALRKQEASQELISLRLELDAKYQAVATADGVLSKASKVGETVLAMGSYLAAKTTELFWQVVSLCAAYIFDTVVFPLGLFILLFWLGRLLARYFFGLRRQRAFQDDLNAMLGRYLGDKRTGSPGDKSPPVLQVLPEKPPAPPIDSER